MLDCVICGKTNLDRDTIGINKKLLGETICNCYCIDCLADYLGCTVQVVRCSHDYDKDLR